METKVQIMNTYSRKLKKSGYSNAQCMEIITSGVIGYNRRKSKLGKVHRDGWETEDQRELRKLT